MVAKRDELARVRRAAGYTQERLAEALAVDVKTVGNWESGKTEPLPYKRPKLARLLDITADQLEALLVEGLVRPSEASGSAGPLGWMENPTPLSLRQRLEQVQRDYDTAPSTSLLAIASQNHGQIGYLRRNVRATRDRRELVVLEAESAILMAQLVWDASQRQDHKTPRTYLEQAVEAAGRSGDKVAEAYAQLRISFLSLYGDKAPQDGLLDAQRSADTAADASPALAGLALLHVAEANAMLGERAACDKALDDARAQLDRVHDVDLAADYLTSAEIDRMAGSCYLFLGLPDQAEVILRPAASALKNKKKSQAIVLGNLSLAYIQRGELQAATTSLHQAIDALETTRGGGGLTVAFEAGRKLRPWRQESSVQDLNDRLFTLIASP
ncbi:helix-turn-helix transcriptional regulator [Amycolatopsis sp. NPDC005961]|uniref:helix-turn-helix transcriptional regulator n=1 Tax=Amycolatopsis sp. NPDC005961 TaxID=3156720 RepID=UPI0033F500BE